MAPPSLPKPGNLQGPSGGQSTRPFPGGDVPGSAMPTGQSDILGREIEEYLNGIVADPMGVEEDWLNCVFQCQEYPASFVADAEELPLTRQLGFPLKYVPYNMDSPNTYSNYFARVLGVDADCTCSAEDLFRDGLGGARVDGAVLLMRENNQPLLQRQIEVLAAYVESQLYDVIQVGLRNYVLDTVEEVAYWQERMRSKVSPQKFASFWESYKNQKIQNGAPEWQNERCPVNIAQPTSSRPSRQRKRKESKLRRLSHCSQQ